MSGVDHYDLDRVRDDLEDAVRRLERRVDDVERSDREARRELFRDLADGIADLRAEIASVRGTVIALADRVDVLDEPTS